MKSNQKFRIRNDEAVSPVIAVILMVAITVVLAATVYVWVSGFSTGNAAQQSIALTRQLNDEGVILTVASASPSLNWNGIKVVISSGTPSAYGIIAAGVATDTADWTSATSDLVGAGEHIWIGNGDSGSSATIDVRIIDTAANAVIGELKGISLDAGDATAPTDWVSSASASSTTVATLTMSEPVGGGSDGNRLSAWTASGATSGAKTVSSLTGSGESFTLTLGSACTSGEVVTVTYTDPLSNDWIDQYGNHLPTDTVTYTCP